MIISNAEKIEAQKEYCRSKDEFMYASEDGICHNCNKDIYLNLTLEYCKEHLITGCSVCHVSFVD